MMDVSLFLCCDRFIDRKRELKQSDALNRLEGLILGCTFTGSFCSKRTVMTVEICSVFVRRIGN